MSRFLVADDDTDNRALLVSVLATMGLDAITAVTGDDALRIARQRNVTAALLDVRMPGLLGTEVCQVLRADARTAALPIMLVSACADRSEISRGLAAGADDYLVKPFKISELVQRVGALLTATPGGRRGPTVPSGLFASLSTRAVAGLSRPAPAPLSPPHTATG